MPLKTNKQTTNLLLFSFSVARCVENEADSSYPNSVQASTISKCGLHRQSFLKRYMYSLWGVCLVSCEACEGGKNTDSRTTRPRQRDEDEIQLGKRAKLGSGDAGFDPAVQDRRKNAETIKQTAYSAKLLANSCELRRSNRQIQPTRRLLEGLEVQSIKRIRRHSAGRKSAGEEADRGAGGVAGNIE